MIKIKTILVVNILLIALSLRVSGQEISPYLFGQNLWLTNGSEGRPGYIDELWPKVEKSGVKLIRIGGADYDHHMPDIKTLTKWVKAVKAIGAEPLMQVSKHQSAKEAADLVRYFNKNDKLHIKYWSIGNEPYHMDKFSIDSISAYIKSHSSAMKAVDPSIKIFVADLAAYYNNVYDVLLKDERKNVAGRDENGNWYIDGVSFHNYPNAKEYSRSDVVFFSVSKIRGMVLQLLEDIEYANKKHERSGEDQLLWGLTEFNITYHNPDDLSETGVAVPSFINGQFWVDIFCMGMEYNAFTVDPWCIQESDVARTYFGYVGAPPEFTPHSTYYHLQMMAENMKGDYVKMKTGNPFFKAFGAVSEESSVIILMNQHSTKAFNIDLSTINECHKNKDISSIKAAKDIVANYSGEIAPNSTVLIVFNKDGKRVKELLYNQDMAVKGIAPQQIN